MTTFEIPGFKKARAVTPEEILRIEAIRNYSRVCFADGKKIVVAKVLRWFEDQLPAEMFIRVHRSHLVNTLYVQHPMGMGSQGLLLVNGEVIAVSRRKKASRPVTAFQLRLACQQPEVIAHA